MLSQYTFSLRTSLFISFVISLFMLSATLQSATLDNNTDVIRFIEKMAKKPQFSKSELEELFKQVKLQNRIVELMDRPYEAKPWHIYRESFLSEQRIRQGIDFWQQHQDTLQRAEHEFGVPASIIVAIIGVETSYGRIQGDYRVIDALSTLAFNYPRRADYFTKELEEFLLLTKELDIDPLSIKGSYAGAMGFGQFMPSSYRNYAVDFSGSGKKDLRKSSVDAIGSVANYFREHGWRSGQKVAVPAQIKGDTIGQINTNTRKPNYPVKTLQDHGISTEHVIQPSDLAMLMALDGKDATEHWLGFHNFYVITRYNMSKHYALAVYQLSEEINQRRQQYGDVV